MLKSNAFTTFSFFKNKILKTINWSVYHSLDILLSWVKLAWNSLNFLTFKYQEPITFFSYFWLKNIIMKSRKKLCPQFVGFYFPRYFKFQYYVPAFFEVGTENTKIFIKKNFIKNCGHGFVKWLLVQICSNFKGDYSGDFLSECCRL